MVITYGYFGFRFGSGELGSYYWKWKDGGVAISNTNITVLPRLHAITNKLKTAIYKTEAILNDIFINYLLNIFEYWSLIVHSE